MRGVAARDSSRWDPMVGVRVSRAMRDTIDSLRDALGGVEDATTSATLRELLRLALVVFDVDMARRVTSVARRRGIATDDAWRSVVEIGLDALEEEHKT